MLSTSMMMILKIGGKIVFNTVLCRIFLQHDKGVVTCKKRWYKINKAIAQFAGCYDQASRNIRSGSNTMI
ncbi:hypothetical protein Ahy_A08g039320 [Arachis hypogaea]|uniref:Uncharacterized protein n=1 Tax=Arachis hypogaea TaxID=3818 RepID=A0A445BVX9_ARAHY|nr:hypothetical protein Ahy_A08g039320 [Arachis hypogaea]